MGMTNKNLAIIPARSGSKGLKDKNIKELNGHPLMYYSIRAAVDSGIFDEVMVSTDSEKYKRIAINCGAEVPFLRSEKNASDIASSWDMVEEVLDNYKRMKKEFDTICLLQPTSPLRKSEDIEQAYGIFWERKAKSVISVCEAEHALQTYGHLGIGNDMSHFMSRESEGRRQDFETDYRLNGAIYIVDVSSLRQDHFIYGEGSYAYIMPRERSIDIDTEFDFELTDFFIKRNKI